jgi:curved DNA-binding protein CbpA
MSGMLSLERHLKVLEMPLHKIPTAKEIKDSYRIVSLKTHPDTLGPDTNNQIKVEYNKRFINATVAHDRLLEIISRNGGGS